MSAIHQFIETESYIRILRELLIGGEDPNGQDGAGRTPLHIAVMKCERDPDVLKETLLVVRELIDHGAEVNLGDNQGWSPLHLATVCRCYEMIDTLLELNADINKKDRRGYTALHYASICSSFRRTDGVSFYDPVLRVVNLLLSYYPDQDIRNENNETPLMLAVRYNELHIVRALLNKNESQNLQDSEGNTIMHYALDQEEVNVDVVLELARQGCSFNVSNSTGKTARDSYLEKLKLNLPLAEVEKAKPISKIILLERYYFSEAEEKCVREISNANKSAKLLEYLNDCYQEIMDMHKHVLSTYPKYRVFKIAMRGAFPRKYKQDNSIPDDVFDNVLYELIRGRYPTYCEVIAAGIYKRYMNETFAKMCCRSQTDIDLSYFHALYLVSFYLSQFEMLNVIIACNDDERYPPSVQCVTHGCSIS